jgi:hypothetical protein
MHEASDFNKKYVKPEGENVQEEHVLVAHSDTVVDPLAMVVESIDAFVTYVTVVRGRCLQNLTIGTYHVGVLDFDKLIER